LKVERYTSRYWVHFSVFYTLIIVLFLQYPDSAIAQHARTAPKPQDLPVELRPPHPPEKTEQRYNIDAKRMSEDMESEDALHRSRELKRIDSSYYVGWMFEGTYKYNHAADYLGFKNAAVPLERAMDLLEKDYHKALALRTDNFLTYYPTHVFKVDYTHIAYYLMNCYSNTDRPEKVYELLRRVMKWKLQHHYYMDCYNYLAWTVHRNRFYTSTKYSFLKNSIDENEQLANRYLDSSLYFIERNRVLNKTILPEMEDGEKMSVWHYKNILFSYALKIDSAEYYFDLMRMRGRLPHNNYANFKAACGDFRTAENEYNIASSMDAGDKRLQEWAYYSSILDIYKAKPKNGADAMDKMIKAGGSTPGFGWYNIAKARCLLYDGQVAEAKRFTDKAAEFKELHIGTTLGQSHYDFSVQLLKLINKERELQMQQFEHNNWYYNPTVLPGMAQLAGDKYLQQFLIINQLAQNPERDKVIYKLFSTESTVAWDEVWFLIKDFSTGFFIKKFENQAQNDERKKIRKYFRLFIAKLKMKQSNYKEARTILEKLIDDESASNPVYERIFLARLYEAIAVCDKEQGKKTLFNEHLYRFYFLFPQLVPFSGLAMNMRLHVQGTPDKEVMTALKDCNINWNPDPGAPAPDVFITFSQSGNQKEIAYYVTDNTGNYVVNKQSFFWQKAQAAGKELAYRLFDIGGKIPEQEGSF
jgi:hypothetical protein